MADPLDELLRQARGDARMDPLSLDSQGEHCDFCSPGDPAAWAFPADEAVQIIPVGGTSRTLEVPIQAGDWYACARCHPYVRDDRWAALAEVLGFPKGSAGMPTWQSFRVARKPGPGHAWPPKK